MFAPRIEYRGHDSKATTTSEYATWHNPFVYFHTIIDDQNYCATNDVARLQTDLASTATTPNLVFVTPNLCHDVMIHPAQTANPAGWYRRISFVSNGCQ